MSPSKISRHIVQMPTSEIIVQGIVAIGILVCATILGLHGEFNSGDLLAVFTMVGTGTATVAGARSGNRERRTTDTENDG